MRCDCFVFCLDFCRLDIRPPLFDIFSSSRNDSAAGVIHGRLLLCSAAEAALLVLERVRSSGYLQGKWTMVALTVAMTTIVIAATMLKTTTTTMK